jgi:hypothetical protein|tara:strand:- start:920 stop:1174 length:255 start_codon:yes stop_codon:yes gene_type:complete
MYELELSGFMCEDVLKCVMEGIDKLLRGSQNHEYPEYTRDSWFEGFKNRTVAYRMVIDQMTDQGYSFNPYVIKELEKWEAEFLS